MKRLTHLKVRSLSPSKAKVAPSTVSTTSLPMVSGCLAAGGKPATGGVPQGDDSVAPPTVQIGVPALLGVSWQVRVPF